MLTTFNTLDLITRPSSDYEIGFNLGGTTGRALLMEVACLGSGHDQSAKRAPRGGDEFAPKRVIQPT